MDPHVVPTPEELAKRYGPQTDEEAMESARAVIAHREQMEALAEVEKLTEFEVRLAEDAYLLGQRELIEQVERALGHAATTADVHALRLALERRPTLRLRSPQPVGFGFGPLVDERALRLVRVARRIVEAEAASTKRQASA